MTNLQIRVDESLLHQAQAVVEDMGIDLTAAIHLFLTKMVQKNTLTFLNDDDPFYSPQNQAHLRSVIDDLEHNRNCSIHDLIEDENAHLA